MTKIILMNREFYRLLEGRTIRSYNFEKYGLRYIEAMMVDEYTPNSRIEYYLNVIDERLFFLSVLKFDIKYEIKATNEI